MDETPQKHEDSREQMVIDLRNLLDSEPKFIPIDKCVTGKIQVKQNTQIKEDDPLVISIRDMGGLIHPIIVKKFEENNETKYDVIIGQRRLNAHILLEMKEINAFVITRDLSETEKKVLTWNEGMQQKPMTRRDTVNHVGNMYEHYGRGKQGIKDAAKALGISTTTVKKYLIEWYYVKYGGDKQGLKDAADTLGITPKLAKNYLIEARLPDKVKKCIENGEFKIKNALKASALFGNEYQTVDVDKLIETAKLLQKLEDNPKRNQVIDDDPDSPRRLIE